MTTLKNFYRGDSRKYVFSFTQTDEQGNVVPVSVHGGILFGTFKSDKDMSDEDAEIKVQQAGIEADPQNPTGQIIVSISGTDTEVEPGYYYYDFQYISPSGDIITVLPGVDAEETDKRVRIEADITRRIA